MKITLYCLAFTLASQLFAIGVPVNSDILDMTQDASIFIVGNPQPFNDGSGDQVLNMALQTLNGMNLGPLSTYISDATLPLGTIAHTYAAEPGMLQFSAASGPDHIVANGFPSSYNWPDCVGFTLEVRDSSGSLSNVSTDTSVNIPYSWNVNGNDVYLVAYNVNDGDDADLCENGNTDPNNTPVISSGTSSLQVYFDMGGSTSETVNVSFTQSGGSSPELSGDYNRSLSYNVTHGGRLRHLTKSTSSARPRPRNIR